MLYAEFPQDTSELSSVFNVTTLQEKFPYMDWREYINWNLKNTTPIHDNEPIYVDDVDFVHQLKKLLETTPKRTLANHFGARLTLYSSDLLDDVLNSRQQQYHVGSLGDPNRGLLNALEKQRNCMYDQTFSVHQ